MSRAQGDLHQVQEEGVRPAALKDELGFAQRRTEELGRRLVEQDAAVQPAQEQVVASMLERLTATPAEPDLTAAKDAEAGGRKVAKKPATTGT